MAFALVVAVLLYLALCGFLWVMQDRMVFPGAGHGDRGVPRVSPPVVMAWLEQGVFRTRIATVAVLRPIGVAIYFGGNGEDLYAAAANAAVIAGYGFEVIGVEHPGFGASGGRPSVASLLAPADAAATYAKARAAVLQVPLVVVGSSLGSFCAVHVAAKGGIDKLVLRAPPTNLVAVAKRQFWWLPVGLLLTHRFDNLAVAGGVRCPALILHGDADTIVPDHYGRELAKALPQARFQSVPGCGHNDLDLSPMGPVGSVLQAFLETR